MSIGRLLGLPRRPMPRRRFQIRFVRYLRRAEFLFQRDRMAFRMLLQRRDQPRGVRHDEDLGALGRARDRPREGRQQIGMEARLGLVENQQTGRSSFSRIASLAEQSTQVCIGLSAVATQGNDTPWEISPGLALLTDKILRKKRSAIPAS